MALRQYLLYLNLYILILMTAFIVTNAQDNIFQFSPNQSHCFGEEVNLTCYLFPTGIAYSSFALISFNGSTPESVNTINANRASIGYSAIVSIPVMGSSARIQLTIASFKESDNNTLFGCHAELSSDASLTAALESKYPPIATPPSPPTALSVSLTSLSPATCSGSVSVAWTPGASDRSIDMYFLFLNGDLLTPLSSSVNSHSYSINIATDTVYTYSVTANSCAGNSTPSNGVSISVESYSLVNTSPLFLSYMESSGVLTLDWSLTPATEILLAYSLQLNYSHSQYGTVYSYTLSSYFSLLSTGSIFPILITPHNFSTTDGVVTNITACISITSQCGMPFYGDVLCGDFNSEYPPTTQPTTATINVLTSTSPTVTTDSVTNPSSIIISVVITVILMSIIFFSIITLLVVVIVYLLRKIKQLQSPPKQTPHPYEYIDLNMVSPDTAAIPSVPKDSAYYTPMQSVGTQGNSNVVPPLYANLK